MQLVDTAVKVVLRHPFTTDVMAWGVPTPMSCRTSCGKFPMEGSERGHGGLSYGYGTGGHCNAVVMSHCTCDMTTTLGPKCAASLNC